MPLVALNRRWPSTRQSRWAIIDGDPVRAHDRMTELILLTRSHIEWVLAHDDPALPSPKV